MLLLFIIQVLSKRYNQVINFKESGFVSDISGYDEIFIEIEGGESLMMVEWEDAVLTIDIPNEDMFNVQFTKNFGYSLFTFKDSATVLINFKKPVSYFYFYCPVHQSNKPIQYVSNVNRANLNIGTFSSDVYVQALGPYTLSSSLTKSGKGDYVLYYGDNKQTTSVTNVYISDLVSISCFHNSASATIKGQITMISQATFKPTVQTSIILEYENAYDRNIVKGNMAYGGYNDDNTITTTFEKVYQKQYLLISNDMNKESYYVYVRNVDGDYVQIRSGEKYEESQDTPFEREVFISTENCYSYTYIETIKSSRLVIKPDGSYKYISIDKWKVPEYCDKFVRIGVFNMVIIIFVVILVVVIVIFVIVIVCIKKKSRKQQQVNDQSIPDRSLL